MIRSINKLCSIDKDSKIIGITPGDNGNIYFTSSRDDDYWEVLWRLNLKDRRTGPQDLINKENNDGFWSLASLTWDQQDKLYICAFEENYILQYSISSKKISRLTERSAKRGYQDGSFKDAYIRRPTSIMLDNNGDLLITDWSHVRKINIKQRTVETIAGVRDTMAYGHQDGQEKTARFYQPSGLAVHPNGAMYVSDRKNFAIRKIKDGIVSTVAGKWSSDDAKARGGTLKDCVIPFPGSLILEDDGTLLVAANRLIRVDEQNNKVTVLTKKLGCYSMVKDNEGNIFLGCKNELWMLTVPWKYERFLWIGFLKEGSDSKCHLNRLPKELVKHIATYIRGESIKMC